jgi:hypothetical protein
MRWEQLVTERLLRPLGMTRTTADFDGAPALGNLAVPHAVIGGVQRAIPRETARASTAPAGAIQASARDLATWMLFQLGDGTFGGKRLISAEAMAEMHAPQIGFPTTPEFRAARRIRYFPAYGFGWQVFDYRGSPMLWHTGGGDGQAASMTILPEPRQRTTSRAGGRVGSRRRPPHQATNIRPCSRSTRAPRHSISTPNAAMPNSPPSSAPLRGSCQTSQTARTAATIPSATKLSEMRAATTRRNMNSARMCDEDSRFRS